MSCKSREELFKKLKATLDTANLNASMNEIKTANTPDELREKLNNAVNKLNIVKEAYSALVNKQTELYEALIGTSIGKYYVEFAKKQLDQINKINTILVSLESSINYDNFQYMIANDLDYSQLLDLLKKLESQFEEACPNVISIIDTDINSQETNRVRTIDTSGSTIYNESKKMVRYAEFIDPATSIKTQYTMTSIYNDSGAKNDNEIYVTCPLLKLSNSKAVLDETDIIRFLWIVIGRRPAYVGVINSDNPEEAYGYKLTFKSWLFSKKFTDSAVSKVQIKIGYHARLVTSQGVTKINDKIAKFDGEDYSIIDCGKYQYILTEIDEDGEDGKGEAVDITIKNSSAPIKYNDKVTSYILFDPDSYSLEDNAESLSDSVSIKIDAGPTFHFNNITLNSDETNSYYNYNYNAEVKEYSFKGTVDYDENQLTEGYAKNQIPIVLSNSVRKELFASNDRKLVLQNTDTLEARIKRELKYKVYNNIKIGVDSDNNAILTTKDAHYAIGLLNFADKPYESKYDVTDIIDARAEYSISNALNTLINIDKLYGNKNILGLISNATLNDKLNKIVECQHIIENAIINYRNRLGELVERLYNSLNSFSLGEKIRESQDTNYTKKYFENYLTSLDTKTAEIKSLIEDGVTNKNIKQINNKFITIENEINSLFTDNLESIEYIDEMVKAYIPIYGNKINYSVLTASMRIAFEVYLMENDYTSTLNINTENFIPITRGSYTFMEWNEDFNKLLKENALETYRYYLVGILLCRLSKNHITNLTEYKGYLSDILKSLYLKEAFKENYFNETFIKLMREIRTYYNSYNIMIKEDLNYGRIPTILTTQYNVLNKFNYIDLTNYIDGETINNDIYRLQVNILISLLKSGNIVSTIKNMIIYLQSNVQNLRTLIILYCINKIISQFKQYGFIDVYNQLSSYEIGDDFNKHKIDEYLSIWRRLFVSNVNPYDYVDEKSALYPLIK